MYTFIILIEIQNIRNRQNTLKQEMMEYLLNVYNYIQVDNAPLLQISLEPVENYPPIQKLLRKLYIEYEDEDQNLQYNYFLLNQFINKQQQSLGPKRFKKLIQTIFTILSQYTINLMRSSQVQVDKVLFHLNYYKKNCGKYIDHFYSSCIQIFYIICNFKTNQVTSIQQKVQQCRLLARNIRKQKQFQKQSNVIMRLCQLFDTFAYFKLKQYKKAKDFSSKIINMASFQLTESIKSKRQPSSIVKIQLILSSLIVSQIYKFMGKYELHSFLINKCIQYSQKFLQQNQQFLRFLKVDQMQPIEMKIKLTRFQEKIRRVELVEEEQLKKQQEKQNKLFKTILKSRHNSNLKSRHNSTYKKQKSFKDLINLKQGQQNDKFKGLIQRSKKYSNFKLNQQKLPLKLVSKKSTTIHYATLRSGQNTTNSNLFRQSKNESTKATGFMQRTTNSMKKYIPTQDLIKQQLQKQSQLKNLLIIKDKKKNYYLLKQQTLKYLNKQNNHLKRGIKIKNKQINHIEKVKQKINNQLDVKNLQTQIKNFQNHQEQLIEQIQHKKWKYIHQLPCTKKINTYFKTFLQLQYYWHAKNVYQLVYGETLNMSQMKLISVLKRKATKKQKQVINQIMFNGVRHQVQYIKQSRQNNQFNFFMNIYQTEKGLNGLNEQIQISQQQYKVIKYEPFYLYYSIYKGKLVKFKDHLESLTLKQNYQVHRFVNKIKKLNYSVNGKTSYVKLYFCFNYQANSHSIKDQKVMKLRKQNQSNSKETNQKFTSPFIKGNDVLNQTKKQQQNQQIPHPQQSQQQQRPQQKDLKSVQFRKIRLQQQQKKYLQQQKKDYSIQNISKSQSPKLDRLAKQRFANIPIKHNSNNLNVLQAYIFIKIVERPLQQKIFQNANSQIQAGQFLLQQNRIINQLKQYKKYEVTVQKISKQSYFNQNYNFSLNSKFQIKAKQLTNYDNLALKALNQKFDSIWSKYTDQIVKIQKHIRKRCAYNKYLKLKSLNQIQTYIFRKFIYTLILSKDSEQNLFFIQNYSKRGQLFIKKDVNFRDLQFLPKVQTKIQKNDSLQQQYKKIQKYIKIKHYATKIFFKSKHVRFFTDFQTQFKKKLCFAKVKNQFLFRGKMRQGKIMYMLTVKQFSKTPRPYCLRIFTLNAESMFQINAQKIIYNKQKVYLQTKLQSINQIIQISSKTQFQIFAKPKLQPTKKVSTRISILSSYSFQSGGDTSKDHIEDKNHPNGPFNRRMSKNSMFAKFRHKALIKNQDLQAIKKLIQQKKFQQQNSSNNSQNSHNSSISSVTSEGSSECQSNR